MDQPAAWCVPVDAGRGRGPGRFRRPCGRSGSAATARDLDALAELPAPAGGVGWGFDISAEWALRGWSLPAAVASALRLAAAPCRVRHRVTARSGRGRPREEYFLLLWLTKFDWTRQGEGVAAGVRTGGTPAAGAAGPGVPQGVPAGGGSAGCPRPSCGESCAESLVF
ncbi:hypothetical protein GCM10027440_53330 [Nocardiopsis coralliicola]